MPAIQRFSCEFFNLDIVLKDLLRDVDSFGGSIGFLTCDASLHNYPHMVKQLQLAVPFPVVGSTTPAFPMEEQQDKFSARFCVLKVEGMLCSVASAPIGRAKLASMHKLYQQCVAPLGNTAKMLMTTLPLISDSTRIKLCDELFELVGDIPLFGGMTAAYPGESTAAVFCNGECFDNDIVLIGFAGDIQPVFSVGCQISTTEGHAPTVTKSKRNTVCETDHRPFARYLDEVGVVLSDGDDPGELLRYGPLPVLVTHPNQEAGDVPEVRIITQVNQSTGCACFSHDVPEGALLELGFMQTHDIVESAEACIEGLMNKMEPGISDGYEYSLVMSAVCVTRYFAQIGSDNLERAVLHRQLPDDYAMHNFYLLNEIAPLSNAEGRLINRTYSYSIAMCAL